MVACLRCGDRFIDGEDLLTVSRGDVGGDEGGDEMGGPPAERVMRAMSSFSILPTHVGDRCCCPEYRWGTDWALSTASRQRLRLQFDVVGVHGADGGMGGLSSPEAWSVDDSDLLR